MTTDLIESFAALFRGNTDAYGLHDGGCCRVSVVAGHYDAHLYGNNPIGVYPIERFLDWDTEEEAYQACRWGCVDIDVKGPNHVTGVDADTAWVQAQNLRTALRVCGITGWVEVTRSGGYHVWVFTTDWCEPKVMRRALLFACEMAGVPPSEVNPKQEDLAPEMFGNYVRLPYPGYLAGEGPLTSKQYMVDQEGDPLSLSQFLADAEESLCHPADLAAMADSYVLNGGVDVAFGGEPPSVIWAHKRLNGLGWTISKNPPLEGQDRSKRLFKLAHCCKDSGLTPDEAVAVVRYADYHHGQKYKGRTDEMRRYQETVRKAYSA